MEPNEGDTDTWKERIPVLLKEGLGVTGRDRAVWDSFKSGNRQAFDAIFENHIRLLYRYGAKITKDQDLVEDCIQDLFIELWKKKEILGDTSSIKFYLFKSLRLKITRRLQQESRLGYPAEVSEEYDFAVEFSPESKIIQEQISREQKERLEWALSQLAKRQREAIYLRFYEKMSYEDIAAVMEVHIKSAYNLVSKGIDALRKVMHTFSGNLILLIGWFLQGL